MGGPCSAVTRAELGVRLGLTWLQLGPTQLGHKLDPCGSNFGPNSAPHGLNTGDISGPIQNRQNSRFHWYRPRFFRIDDTSCRAMFHRLCLRWAQLGAKLLPKGPKLHRVEHDLDLHVHHMASIWKPSGSIWAQLQPNMTIGLQLGRKLGPT